MDEKRKFSGNIIDFCALILCYITSFAFFNMFITFIYGYKLFIAYMAIFVVATAYITIKKKKFNKEAIFPGVVSLVLAFSMVLHSDTSILVIFMLILTSGLYCLALTQSNNASSSSWLYYIDLIYCEFLAPIFNIIKSFIGGLGFFQSIKKDEEKKNNLVWIVVGILLAIPVIFIIVPLLSSSDVAFESITKTLNEKVQNIFNDISGDFVISFVLTAILGPYIYSVMFSFANGEHMFKDRDYDEKLRKLRICPDSFITAFLTTISVTYIIYMLSQFSYLFSAFTGHLPNGTKINVIQYARSGFFGLMAIAGINLVLIAFVVIFSKKQNGAIKNSHKILVLFLSIYTLFITATSIAKLLMYMNMYGLTEKRVAATLVDIVIIIAFICVAIRLYVTKFPYAKIITASVCIVSMAYMLIGPGNIITSYNIDAYLNGKIKTLDIEEYYYRYDLGLDVVEKLVEKDIPEAKDVFDEIIVGYIYSYVWDIDDEPIDYKNYYFEDDKDIEKFIDDVIEYHKNNNNSNTPFEYRNHKYFIDGINNYRDDLIRLYKDVFAIENTII